MAPARTNSDDSKYSPPPLEEIIFSCGICQATVSELYPPGVHNPHSHSDDDDGMGTKLWIANCVHVFCGRHLEGGGVAFHSSSEPPQAICPVCARTENNHEVRNLYGIRGLTEGKLDSAIPPAYAECPPVSLDGNDPGAEALRFQYSRMKTYSQEVTRRWKHADRKRRAVESTLHKERKQHRSLDAEHQDLQVRHDELSKKLQGWEARKGQIKHYMSAVGEMARDIQMMRRELVKLGYPVEHKTYGLEAGPSLPPKPPPLPRSVRGDSSTTLVNDQSRTSSSKRKRGEYDAYPDYKEIDHEFAQDDANRLPSPSVTRPRAPLLMQPPADPATSIRTVQPPLVGGHETSLQSNVRASRATQAYRGSAWNNAISATSSRRFKNPVPTMRSMNLNSGAASYYPPQNRGVSMSHQDADHGRHYKQRETPGQWPSQPERPQPHNLYSYSGTERPQDYYELPQAVATVFDAVQEDDLHCTERYNSDSTAYHGTVPADTRTSGRESYLHGNHNQSMLRPRHHPVNQPDSSILSPFFKSNTKDSRTEQSAPPYVRDTAQPQGKVVQEGGLTLGRMARSKVSVHGPVMAQGATDSSYFNRYTSRQRQRADQDQPTLQSYCPATPHRIYNQSPDQPLCSQAIYRHPAAAMPPPPPAQPYRMGRVTLPPSSTGRRGWDPQVSQVRGVRGAGPFATSHYTRQDAVPPYSARGSVYSQAGNRSIVRR